MQDNVKTNSLKAWILAARPKTLSGAAVPVMIGSAMAYRAAGDDCRLLPMILCFLFAFIMQIDSNFINDYFDCIKGNDDSETRLGPKRACSEGWITLPAMRIGLAVTTLLGCAVGLPLVLFGGMEMIVVGMLCVLFAFLYTTKLSYMGLGDLLVLVFFGIVPVCLTYYVIVPELMQYVPGDVFMASVACGFVIDTLLIINNYRDRDNDRCDGKITLVVRIGEKNTERLYLWIGIVAVVVMDAVIACGIAEAQKDWMMTASGACLMSIVYLALHIKTLSAMKKINHGRELNRILGMTARNMFVFGLLSSLAIIAGNL